ncbi:MAG: nucleotidyltransferase [Pseudomonadota bacterium]
MGVGEWFSDFCSAGRLGTDKRGSIATRTERITARLNLDFRGLDSKTANRFYVGSYGRSTAIPSVSDVDLLYELPATLFQQYDAYKNNGQSSLLSAIRASLQKTYSSSSVAGDGQVIVINFNDGIKFEILPAFLNTANGYTFADTNGGGSWKSCKPKQEMAAFATRNDNCSKNLVELGRMARAWRDRNNVPMGGMLIDTLAYQFIETWEFRNKSYFYYDYMTRDFFKFLAGQNRQQSYWLAPGSGSYVYRGGLFEYKARQAELLALEAIQYQNNGHDSSAKKKYREIYGTSFPA